ncbi:CoA transferase [Polymorphobacter arshaanensis]|uniref:CoA transferase n=1 Tax=Glacieibacterium arshaanense TaxID=2511025 RepID=A0A4Y9EKA7_9SPHN|nr:CoA transferase [Polymorphobacter arshaanensis]TFU01222.1 CoA transferase [Polymorphobacter arshaanensis]
MTAPRALPLAGIRIISAEAYGAGPYGTLFLAQLGADVIKIEPPQRHGKGGGDTARAVGPHWLRDGESLYFQTFNLNKRSLTLDLATPDGQAVLHRLVLKSDAVANNLRGDIPAKLGLTYDALAGVNPAIVCAHISAYGRDNARAAWPGYDYLMQAEAGFCALTGEPDGPPVRFGLSMVDYMTGTMMAVGLLAALLDAQRTGKGSDVDVDLFSAAVHQTSYPALWYMNEADVTPRAPRGAHPTATPSQMFRTADGWMFVMAQLPKFWEILVQRIGHPELAHDSRFLTPADRRANRETLTQLLDTLFETQPTAHWCARLEGHVPVAPVNELPQALDNPWLDTIAMKQTVAHPDRADLQVLASPIRIDGDRLPGRAAPLLGADSDAILGELGYDADEIARLRADGTV